MFLDDQFKYAFKIALAFFTILIGIYFFTKMVWILSLIIISLLIVYSLSPAVDYLAGWKKMPRIVAVVFVYLLFLCLIVLAVYLIIPIMIAEIRDLARLLPTYSRILQPYIYELAEVIARPELVDIFLGFLQQLPGHLQEVMKQATSITVVAFSRLAEVLIVMFMVFYLLRDLDAIKATFVDYLPRAWRNESLHVLEVIDEKVGAYLRGNFVRCTVVGVFTGTGLAILGMPFSFMLGVLAGILNIIVYIGPYIAAIPAVIIALSVSLQFTFIIILLYIVIQSLDAFVITPFLLGRAVNLHPFTVIVAILIGASLLGLLGIILGIPAAATMKVLFNYYRKEI